MQEETHAVVPGSSLVAAIRTDLIRLHESWMGLIYPRQRHDRHPVLGKWKPRTTSGLAGYRLWAAVGAPIIALLYPFVLLGLIIRFQARSLNRTVTRLGLLGVVLFSVVIWGGLTVVARLQFDYSGFLAVFAAAIVATVSAVIAYVAHRVDGRFTTVAIAYPAAMTAIFLPPVVAALFSPVVGSYVFTVSEDLAIWLLNNVLFIGGIDVFLRENFDLIGIGYVAMWLGISVPLGWALGILVTLADVIRPTREQQTESTS